MAKVGPVIKEWYGYLNQGKLMGMKCRDCGAIEFPPVAVCDHCGGLHMEWTEIDPEGTVFAVNSNSTGIHPFTNEVSLSGYIRLKDGTIFISRIDNYGVEKQDELIDRIKKEGPLPAELVVGPLDENFKYPWIHIK
jgi:uncharacterized OB-fold protein